MKARTAFALLVSILSLASFAESTIEGTVRSVDPDILRIVVVTPSDEIVAAYGKDDTPVRFEGSTYRIRNLEVGDRVRLTLSGEGDDRRVDSVDVLESVSPAARPGPRDEVEPAIETPLEARPNGVTLTSVLGKVDQVREDRNLIRVISEDGMNWVRIDATNARTPSGESFDVSDLEFGERIEAVGTIGGNGELVATIIRREDEVSGNAGPVVAPVGEPEQVEATQVDAPRVEPPSDYVPEDARWLAIVEFGGEVVATLDGKQQLTIRNDITGADEVVWCDESLIAMVDDEDPIPAEDLEEGMRVEIRTLRVSEGLVAQSIRVEE